MQNLRDALPQGSILHHWLDARSIYETPVSYDLITGLAAVGAQLKRGVWFDQKNHHIYPTFSVLLIGASGTGKDTAINAAIKQIIQHHKRVKVVEGKTIEAIQAQLALIDPACAVIPAKEFADFFGGADYKQGMLAGITDLLSGNDAVDISLKGKPGQTIRFPTITMFGGSTVQWLHTGMPKDAMDGGFYPRFVIICEDAPKRKVAVVKALPPEELMIADTGLKLFHTGVQGVIDAYGAYGEIAFLRSAERLYQEWYDVREKDFSLPAERYAFRCRDNCLRIAMISAMCQAERFITVADVEFAITCMKHVAARIDRLFAPQTIEARIIADVLRSLPIHKDALYVKLQKQYRPQDIKLVCEHLRNTRQILCPTNGDYVKP